MKKVFTLLLALLLLVIPLFANGEKESSTDAKATNMTMTWWGGQTRHELTQKVFDAYQEKTGIKIEGTPSNWDGYFEKLATQAASGSMPDIVQMDYLYINTYASNGSLLDLTQYTKDGTIDTSTISETLLSSGVIDGKLVGIPVTTSILAFPTNTKVLEEAGVEVPTSDWTWDDFIEICHTVKEKTGKYGLAILPTSDTNFFNYWVRQHGESLFNEDGTALGYSDDSIMIEWLDMWKELSDSGCVPNPDEYAQIKVAGTDSSPIITDNAAFIQEWNNFNTKVQGKNDNLVLVTPPLLEGGELGLWLKPGMFLSISSNSTVKDSAAEFINWFENGEEANSIMMAERGTPSSSTVRDYMTASGKLTKAQAEMFQYTSDVASLCGESLPPDPQGAAEITKAYQEAVNNVLYGLKTSSESAKDFRTEANKILARNN